MFEYIIILLVVLHAHHDLKRTFTIHGGGQYVQSECKAHAKQKADALIQQARRLHKATVEVTWSCGRVPTYPI